MISEAYPDWTRSRIVYVNQAFTSLLGYSAAEVVGQTPRLLLDRSIDRAAMENLKHDLATRHAFYGELAHERRDGVRTTLELSIMPLRDTAGRITHWVTTLSDITTRKQLDPSYSRLKRSRVSGGSRAAWPTILTTC